MENLATEPVAETPLLETPAPAAAEQPSSAAVPSTPAAQPPAAAPIVETPAAVPDLELLLATAREQERIKVLAEVQAERAREQAEAEAAEARRVEEGRRAEMTEFERVKLEATEAQQREATEKAAREAAEAKAAATEARANLLRELSGAELRLQTDPAVENLALDRVAAKLAADPTKSTAAALAELHTENPWLFRGTSAPVPPTNLGGEPAGRGSTIDKRPAQPKPFNAMTASPGEVNARIIQIQREQQAAQRR
jgi:hypothetical protein